MDDSHIWQLYEGSTSTPDISIGCKKELALEPRRFANSLTKLRSAGVLSAAIQKRIGATSASQTGYKSFADRCAALNVLHRPTNRPEFLRVTPWKTRLAGMSIAFACHFESDYSPRIVRGRTEGRGTQQNLVFKLRSYLQDSPDD